jgi:EpsI family protein
VKREELAVGALCAALVAAGGLAWWLALQPPLAVDASALNQLPDRIDGWRGRDLPMDSAVEAELGAEVNLQRAYVHPTRDVIWLYVGYYGTGRGGRPEHTPRGCYTGAGWSIVDQRTLDVDREGRLRVNEFLVERQGERRLVHFWFRSHRRTGMLGGIDQNIDRLLGRLLDRRADGALVRLSSPVGESDVVPTRSRLLAFASRLDPLLAERWPREKPAA